MPRAVTLRNATTAARRAAGHGAANGLCAAELRQSSLNAEKIMLVTKGSPAGLWITSPRPGADPE